ncbi:unnamed protein product [Darwinula stevensoni]|uniref:N-acetylgalactosaminide beta-1,3-galactosyltransferase n=1 Tax=Darwinula stevensoni TaxID=69355 RepID=A0A7R9AAN0_9CRUS|nr:unnamed protein product [Darwinula stevensoni]CAG0898585.1 unnamed protein product [Darwinula stevensoni]
MNLNCRLYWPVIQHHVYDRQRSVTDNTLTASPFRIERALSHEQGSPKKEILGALICGLCVGSLFAYIFISSSYDLLHPRALFYSRAERERGPIPTHPEVDGKAVLGDHSRQEVAHRGEGVLAEEISRRVRVLCLVLTQPENHEKKAKHVKATWGKRCNVLLFMSSQEDPSLPTVALKVKEDRDELWNKTREAFRYVYQHHRNDADWFLKADDDTYVIVENLRHMLLHRDPLEPVVFGCWLLDPFKGYVLSREALARFVEKALPNPKLCSLRGIAEDVSMCLSLLL